MYPVGYLWCIVAEWLHAQKSYITAEMRILGIETSCDDSAVCIIDASGHDVSDFKFRVLGNALSSQAAAHAPYGGVFPNLARSEHQKNLVPLLARVIHESKPENQGPSSIIEVETILAREQELSKQLLEFLKTHEKPDVDTIAVTVGPGLEPALWVGINFAKALAHAWQIPIVPVNHMEGHMIISTMYISGDRNSRYRELRSPDITGQLATFTFPTLALLISGAHTELILSREWMQYEYIGRTRDDAVGEAFDKVARMLSLGYPGGPEISRLALDARKYGLRKSIFLPRPMIREKNYDFSFAGLKTAVLKMVETNAPVTLEFKKQLAREFEDAVTDVLEDKTMRAVETFGIKTLVIGGGVSANRHIRSEFAAACEKTGTVLLIPPPEFATDNALMIALAGYFRARAGQFSVPDKLRANGSLKLGEGEEMPA